MVRSVLARKRSALPGPVPRVLPRLAQKQPGCRSTSPSGPVIRLAGALVRFVSTTLTVPAAPMAGKAAWLTSRSRGRDPNWAADVTVMPGGGLGSVLRQDPLDKFFDVSPNIGVQLAVGIFYDQHGHSYCTAADLTQGICQAVRADAGRPLDTIAWLRGLRVSRGRLAAGRYAAMASR